MPQNKNASKALRYAVYKDKRWEPIRQEVIRRDKDICYFCHKLILKRRTIHHLLELNESNFKDDEVAFNLDLLVECHNTCHDEHHERFGYKHKDTIVDDDLNIDYSKRGKGENEIQNTIYKSPS